MKFVITGVLVYMQLVSVRLRPKKVTHKSKTFQRTRLHLKETRLGVLVAGQRRRQLNPDLLFAPVAERADER